MSRKIVCPKCGDKVVKLTEHQGHAMCEECACFCRIAGTKLPQPGAPR